MAKPPAEAAGLTVGCVVFDRKTGVTGTVVESDGYNVRVRIPGQTRQGWYEHVEWSPLAKGA